MSYREPEIASVSGPLKKLSWTLIVIGAALLLFVTWHQIVMATISERYGIQTQWVGLLFFFFLFVGLEVGAVWAARRRHYPVSIGLSGFVVALLGFVALLTLAQIGM